MTRSTTDPPKKPTAEDYAFSRLCCFAKYIYPKFVSPPHVRRLARVLEEVERSGGRRVIVSIPPRHGKSFLASQLFPAWFFGRNPEKMVITIAYGDDLATDFGRAVRNFIADPCYQDVFPGVSLAADSRSTSRFRTNLDGSYFAVGVGGAITGRGADLLIVDDSVKNWEEAQSKGYRQKIIDWFLSTAYTRLQKNGSVVVINTRWHDDDLPGYLLKHDQGNAWEEICLPALDADDEPLSPEFFGKLELLAIRKTLGSRIFSCLYQGKPIPEVGGIICGAWFQRYSSLPAGKLVRVIQSWDTAVKDGELNDYSACVTLAEFPGPRYYVIDVFRARLTYPALKLKAKMLISIRKPDVVLIEDKGSGSILIQELAADPAITTPILAVVPVDSKQTRFIRCSPKIEAGQVFLPGSASWLAEYESELVGYPTVEHDDQVDATSQALNYCGQVFYGGVDWESVEVGEVTPAAHWDYYASVFWRPDQSTSAVLYFGVSENRDVSVLREELPRDALPIALAELVGEQETRLPKKLQFVLGNPELWAKKGVADSSADQFKTAGIYLKKGVDDQRQGLTRVREYLDAGKLKIDSRCPTVLTALKTLSRDEKDVEKADANLTAARVVEALWSFLLTRPLESGEPVEKVVFSDGKSQRAYEALQKLKQARKQAGW